MRGRGLVIVAAVALAVRLAVVLATPDYAPIGDAADYDRYATALSGFGAFPFTQIAEPYGATAYRPPGYPVVLAAAYEVTGQRFTAGRLANVLLGTIAVLLLYALVTRLWDRRAALWVAAAAAVAPPLVWLSATLLSENLFVPLVLATALCVALQRERGGLPLAAAAGALLGLAVLTRSNALVLALPVVLGLAHGTARRHRLAAPAVALAALVVALVPWTARNLDAFGRVLPLGTQSGFTMAGAWNAPATDGGPLHTYWALPQTVEELAPLFGRRGTDEAELDAQLRERAIDYATAHPGDVAAALVTNVPRTFDLGPGHTDNAALSYREMGVPGGAVWLLRGGTYLLLALAAAGLALRPGGPLWLWLIPLLILASQVPFTGSPRYGTVLYPFLAIPVAAALRALWRRTGRS